MSFAEYSNGRYNQWTRVNEDPCTVENRMRLSTKPLKYYANPVRFNDFTNSFDKFTVVGNQKQYDVRNEFERAIPSRLNPLYSVETLPHATTPFLGSRGESMAHVDHASDLRPIYIDSRKGSNDFSSVDFNRWEYIDNDIIQHPDHIIFDTPRGGLSSRNEYHNYMHMYEC